jgi:hypothetical protein
MGKIRAGGYIFVTWIGDHEPRHVHVFKDGQFVAKWDLDNGVELEGRASRRVRRLIGRLQQEGRL